MPPFVDPVGTPGTDSQALESFVLGTDPYWSSLFHTEGPALVGGRAVTMALRVGKRSVLVRTDPSEDLEPARHDVEQALARAGYQCCDEETLWGTPVALQVLGLRMSTWDLWGEDLEVAFAELRSAAEGEEDAPIFGSGPVGGWL